MTYNPTSWFDRPNATPKIKASDLNRIEQGIYSLGFRSSVTITGTTTLTAASSQLQLCDAVTSAFTVTLPSTTTAGILFQLKKVDSSANVVTVAVGASADSATSVTLVSRWDFVTVVSTTAAGVWNILGGNVAVAPSPRSLGTNNTPVAGLVRVGDATTTNTGGLEFGGDTWLYRSNGNNLTASGGFTVSGRFTAAGGYRTAVTINTTNTTIGFGMGLIQFANASSGAITMTLPNDNSWPGATYTVKKIDSSANAVTVTVAGSGGTIDGVSSVVLSTQNKFVTVISTSSAGLWYIIGQN